MPRGLPSGLSPLRRPQSPVSLAAQLADLPVPPAAVPAAAVPASGEGSGRREQHRPARPQRGDRVRGGNAAAAALARASLVPETAEACRLIRQLSETQQQEREAARSDDEAGRAVAAELNVAFDRMRAELEARRAELLAEVAASVRQAAGVRRARMAERQSALDGLRRAADSAEALLRGGGPEGEMMLVLHGPAVEDDLRARCPQSALLSAPPTRLGFSHNPIPPAAVIRVYGTVHFDDAAVEEDDSAQLSPLTPTRNASFRSRPYGFPDADAHETEGLSATMPTASVCGASFSGGRGSPKVQSPLSFAPQKSQKPWCLRFRPAAGAAPKRGWIVHRIEIQDESGMELATDPQRIRAVGAFAERVGGDAVSRRRAAHIAPDPISKPSHVLQKGMAASWLQMWGAPKGSGDDAWIEYECPPGSRPSRATVTTSRAVDATLHVPPRVRLDATGPDGRSISMTRMVMGRDSAFDCVVHFPIDTQ